MRARTDFCEEFVDKETMRCYKYKHLMLPLSCAGRSLAFLSFVSVFQLWICAQASVFPLGVERGAAGTLPGDQVWPHVSVSSAGGYLVWQGNATRATSGFMFVVNSGKVAPKQPRNGG